MKINRIFLVLALFVSVGAIRPTKEAYANSIYQARFRDKTQRLMEDVKQEESIEDVEASSQESLKEEVMPDSETLEANQAEQQINDFVKALGELENLNYYQISYTLTDVPKNEVISKGKLVGNQEEGDLLGTLSYFFPEASPSQYDFEFISYRHFDLAYVKMFKLLNSMAFFNQPYFAVDVHQQVEELTDTFVSIDSSELNRINLSRDPYQSLVLLPDLNRLSRISADKLYKINDMYLLSLERLEIPEYLFRTSNNFGMAFQLGMEIDSSGENEAYADWQVSTDHRFELTDKGNSLNFGVTVNSEITDLLLPQAPEGVERYVENFSKVLNMDSNVMLDKLTKVNIVYNPTTQTYRVSLVGIVENIEFNLFSHEAAGLETTEYRLDYEIKPIIHKIPQLDEINKLTAAEADYLLEELLNP